MKRLLLFAALIAWSGMASAVVYKWVDAQGKVQYGDRPPDGVNAEVVELLGTHVARAAPAKAPDSNGQTQVKPDPTKKAVEEDVAQAGAAKTFRNPSAVSVATNATMPVVLIDKNESIAVRSVGEATRSSR